MLETFLGNRAKREEYEHIENKARFESYGREFSYDAPTRGRFDMFMDGINRIPRPLFVFHIFGLFWLAIINPEYFMVVMAAMGAVPAWLWGIMAAIVTFFFGGRHQAHQIKADKVATKQARKLKPAREKNWQDDFFEGN